MMRMLAASMLVLCSALPARAASESPYGVNAHIPAESDLDAAVEAGFGWVRYDFNWFQIESVDDQFDWSVQDAAVNAAADRGLSVFVTIAYGPAWAAADQSCVPGSADPSQTCETEPFADVAEWQEFVRTAVARYEDRVQVWGMWNEPNLQHFYQGTLDQYVNDILIPGSAAVHAECATCLVAGPETAGLTVSSSWNGNQGTCAFGACIRNGWERDLGMVLAAGGASIDVVTHHFYNDDAQAEAVGQWCDGQFFGDTMTHDSLRGVLASAGAAGKPVWLTETGLEVQSGNTEEEQAALSVGLLDARREMRLGTYAPAVNDPFTIDKVFLYHLRGGGWGLLRDDGSRRPAFDAVADFIAAHPTDEPLSTPTPSPTPTGTGTPGPTATPTPGTNADPGSSAGGCSVIAHRANRAPSVLLLGVLLLALLRFRAAATVRPSP